MSTRAEFQAVIESRQTKIERILAARAAMKSIEDLYRDEKGYHEDDIKHWDMVLLNLEDIASLARHEIQRCNLAVPLDLHREDGEILAHVDRIDGEYRVMVEDDGPRTIEDVRRLGVFLE